MKHAFVNYQFEHGVGTFNPRVICNHEIPNSNSNFQMEIQSDF